MLAAEFMRRQNIEIIGLTFETPFFQAKRAQAAALQINLPLIVENFTNDHLAMLKSPRYGYGKNMNPCIDCHTLMLKHAGQKLEKIGAEFIITGEVVGQRPMSQTKQSLYIVAKNSGYADYILRPLSALLLPPIKAETEGKIDRARLLGIQGRGRKEQLRMAASFGINSFPPPAGGCLLTDPMFSRRLRDLFFHKEDRQIRDFELLKYGRHFRTDHGKIIVGRNKTDNEALQKLAGDEDLICQMNDYPGPFVMVPCGDWSAKETAASLCVRYSDAPGNSAADVNCQHNGNSAIIRIFAASAEDCERWMI